MEMNFFGIAHTQNIKGEKQIDERPDFGNILNIDW